MQKLYILSHATHACYISGKSEWRSEWINLVSRVWDSSTEESVTRGFNKIILCGSVKWGRQREGDDGLLGQMYIMSAWADCCSHTLSCILTCCNTDRATYLIWGFLEWSSNMSVKTTFPKEQLIHHIKEYKEYIYIHIR